MGSPVYPGFGPKSSTLALKKHQILSIKDGPLWSAGNAPIFFWKKQPNINATHPRPTRILLFYFGANFLTQPQKKWGLVFALYEKTPPGMLLQALLVDSTPGGMSVVSGV